MSKVLARTSVVIGAASVAAWFVPIILTRLSPVPDWVGFISWWAPLAGLAAILFAISPVVYAHGSERRLGIIGIVLGCLSILIFIGIWVALVVVAWL